MEALRLQQRGQSPVLMSEASQSSSGVFPEPPCRCVHGSVKFSPSIESFYEEEVARSTESGLNLLWRENVKYETFLLTFLFSLRAAGMP